MTAQQLQDLYNQPTAGPVETQRVTMDDVIMKTLALFAIVLVTGAVGWAVSANNPAAGFALWIGGMIGTLVLGLVIAFKKTLSVPLILLYAVVEGLFIGAVSQFFNRRRTRGIVGAGRAGHALDLRRDVPGLQVRPHQGHGEVPPDHDDDDLRLRASSPSSTSSSRWSPTPSSASAAAAASASPSRVFAVGLASFTLALDFDSIERAIRSGAPQKYSWLLAHGLIVTLVWLYIEFLRLFARLRE